MTFLDRVLDGPSYGYLRDGKLYVPTHREIVHEFFSRMNVVKSKKNWLAAFSWITTLSFAVPLVIFFTHYFSWPLLALGFVYSMVVLGSHGTFWLHRYSTHRAFQFRNPLIRQICRNLVVKIIPEETYVVSHYVHHQFPELPGDPYNPHGGWLYCFLADVNHQAIARNLCEKDYLQLRKLLSHTGVRANSYAQYQRWGSICHPFFTILHFALNWAFWYAAFYMIGGHALATALFGSAGVWAIGVRTYNYDGHGGGKKKHRSGVDFHEKDLSINQLWPGYVAGEWHNNHHLYPNGARSGFLRYQLDLPWLFIRSLSRLRLITSYRDYKDDFVKKHLLPYRRGREGFAFSSTQNSQGMATIDQAVTGAVPECASPAESSLRTLSP
jgi:stearoyl-CoA desaturase (delta-9 desaturase)